MTTDAQRKVFGKAFVAFINVALDEGKMRATDFAALLAVTLGRFIHDFLPREARARTAAICAQAIVKVAIEEDSEDETEADDPEPDEPESVH